MKGFQETFEESTELRRSLSEYYAVVIEFCTESLQFLKKNCRSIDVLVSCFLFREVDGSDASHSTIHGTIGDCFRFPEI